MMVKFPDKCPKCQAPAINGQDSPWCFNCGESPFVQVERKQWYKDNEKKLVAHLAEHGGESLQKTYAIPSQYISHLKGSTHYKKHEKPAALPAASTNGKLPDLPAFSDNWPAEVQVQWLQVYRDLRLSRRES